MKYSKHFFERTIRKEGPSAKVIVDILMREFVPTSVVDIGCGVGIYLAEFEKRGVEILGLENSDNALEMSLVGDKIQKFDLEKKLKLDSKFDLALCIEVAEHLREEFADTLVDSLIALSNTIVFTAATPGQGDERIGHFNEQPHEYWIEKFDVRGFKYRELLSHGIRCEMGAQRVAWWVTKNFMIFQRNDQ